MYIYVTGGKLVLCKWEKSFPTAKPTGQGRIIGKDF